MTEDRGRQFRLLMVNPYPVHLFRSTANLVRFCNLADRFQRDPDVKLTLFTGGGRAGGAGWSKFGGTPHYILPGGKRPGGFRGLLWFMLVSPFYAVKLFRSVRPDLVYVSESYCCPLVLTLRLFYGRRARITYDVMGLNARQVLMGGKGRSLRSLFMAAIYWSLDNLIFASVSLVTTINETHRQILENSLGRTVPVVRDGIDPERFAPRVSRERSSALVLVFIGKLAHRRLDTLFAALPDILESLPDLTVRIVGGGPDQARYAARRERLGILGEQVRLEGFVDPQKIPSVLAAADIAYSDDWSTIGFPLKVYEYMAAGLPLVVEDTPAVREVLQEGRTALFYRDCESLIRSVALLAEDAELRDRMGRTAAIEVRENYTWSATSIKLLKKYRECATIELSNGEKKKINTIN
jgi:glycosyltransferase involved in cell wall biosynthesis